MPVVAMHSHGEPVFRVLEVMIREAKRDDPLAPVTVVVPRNFTGLSLRRRLGAAGAVVNVRFLVFARMAELLGAARLPAGLRPLTPWRRAEAIRAALSGDAGIFQQVAQHAATESALEATFRDLRGASTAALEHLAASSARGESVVKLYRRFRQLTAGTFDAETLAESAAVAVYEGAGALGDLGHVVFYLPRSFSPGERSLVDQLVRRDAADFVFGVTYDPQADQATTDLATSLGASVPPGTLDGELPTATRILCAVDTEEEVRSVVRLILAAAAKGTPLYRVGVLYPSADSYAPLLLEQFGAAGIPVNGPAVRPLAASVAGRVLLRMLELPGEDFRRDAVMEWLTSGPIVETRDGDAAGRWVSAARWDETSRAAGVVKGLAQWRARLEAWANAERRSPSPRAADVAERLAAFVEELDKNLRTPRPATPEGLGQWALGLLDRYLGSETAAGGWGNDTEAAAYQDMRKRLDAIAHAEPLRDPETGAALSPFARLEPAVARRTFARALEQALAQPSGRLGRFGDGVFVGPVSAGRGMHFDHVFVLGMVEGSMPAATREDPLLTEDERDGAGLARRDLRRVEARGDYLAALASAPGRTLCFPQSSLREQAKRTPSRWLLESASALAAEEVSGERLAEIRSAPWLTGVESFEHALGSERFAPASAQEWELRSLLRQPDAHTHFLAAEPSFGASVEAATVRLPPWSRRHPSAGAPVPLSPWAGGVGPGVSVDSARVYSPTSFETLAACAFRYFLSNVVRVRETERPEGIVRISGADRGNIIHDSLERFLREVHDAGRSPGPGTPWTSADAVRLLEVGNEECDRAYRRGITGSELLWHVDRARIRRDLSLFLGADSTAREETRATFVEAEWSFEKAVITLDDGRELAFRGRIDRVDRADDGTLIVYDYKTGAADGFERIANGDDPLGAGTRLQLPIYAIAVRGALGSGTARVHASYWFASEREKFRRVGYTLEPAHEDTLRTTLGVLAGTVEAGAFLAVPGKKDRDSYKNCRFCPYDRVCGAGDRARAWDERKGAPELVAYTALSEPVEEATP